MIESLPEDLSRPLMASIQDTSPGNEAIKQAVQNQVAVPGTEVYRGNYLRLASMSLARCSGTEPTPGHGRAIRPYR